MDIKNKKIAVNADETSKAQQAKDCLVEKYNFITDMSRNDIELLIVLGGDGFMLHTLHNQLRHPIPVYGMNCGTVGFLMNNYSDDCLLERLNAASSTTIKPLEMKAIDSHGKTHRAIAINEVSLLRQTSQAAHVKITVDQNVQLECMVCDGVLVATDAGSTAYNFSVGGPIIPLGSKILALTPISPFRPRRWKGALLPNKAKITFDILDAHKRPVSSVADFNEFRNIVSVTIWEKRSKRLTLMFDPEHGLEERIIREQFVTQ
ncbi:MAG: NAD kinase [Rickettsiales bacterium]|nr:NAD kinase [Rickettsiales bacterium]